MNAILSEKDSSSSKCKCKVCQCVNYIALHRAGYDVSRRYFSKRIKM